MRSLILLLIGLFMGAAMALVGLSALRQGTSYPDGLMTVLAAQKKGLGDSLKQNRCSPTDLAPRLQLLRLLGNEIEPAFLPTEDDERFGQHAASFRKAMDQALAEPASSCIAASLTLDKIGAACQDCHRDFKH